MSDYDLARERLILALDKLSDHLEAKASRDPREPARRKKLARQQELQDALERHMRKYRADVREALARNPNYTPQISVDDASVTEISRIMTDAARDGVNLFASNTALQIDWALPNAEAAQWARQYAYDLVSGINETSRTALAASVESFVNVSGVTVGDIMRDIEPYFGADRAANIATTEITRAYAQANQLSGEALQREYPNVKVVKRWFTNRDSLVCPVCAPLNNARVGVDENFVSGNGVEIATPPAHPNCRCWISTTTEIE